MRALLEKGYVYIAQPPLYKVKRGKREEYIETEEELTDLILDLGLEGLKLTRIKGKQTFSSAQLKDILGSLTELEHYIKVMHRRGIAFEDYIKEYDEKKQSLPMYMIKNDGQFKFIADDKELAELTKDAVDMKYIEIFEGQDVLAIQKKFEKLGLTLTEFVKPEIPKEYTQSKSAKKEKGEGLKPLFSISSDDDEHEFYSLKEVLDFVREQAGKGIHIQRYKGLGEMNPQQLWETTMDPARRTILRVTLEDVVEVDKIFSVLMGDEVEPRRKFIEANAHEVKDLDI